MDANLNRNMIDVDYAADISNRMQIPSRLSLTMPQFSSADNVSARNAPSGIIVSGSHQPSRIFHPYDFPASRLSLEPPPESIVLSQVDYPDIDRVNRSQYPPNATSRGNSNLSLFHGGLCENSIGNVDDDRTLVEVDAKVDEPLKPQVHGEDLEGVETRMQELVVRVASLEAAVARQQRRDLIILLLLGVYLLAKLGRPLLRN
ncbi:hypothetical protein Aperf_G00000052242 [Anoplocephala perfoliata]